MITYAIIEKTIHNTLRSYQKTFNDDKHFENWCAFMNRNGNKIMDVFEIKN